MSDETRLAVLRKTGDSDVQWLIGRIDRRSAMVRHLLSRREADRRRIEALEKALRGANDVLRSAAEIAKRDGCETNWAAFKARLNDVLYDQHRLMVSDHDKTCGVPACLAWNASDTASASSKDGEQ